MVHKAMLKRTMSSLSIKFVRFMRSLRERTGMNIIYSDNHLVLRNRSGSQCVQRLSKFSV